VSLTVLAGEILGVAGVQGNGQTELTEALTGLRHACGGRFTILDHDNTHSTPRQIAEEGVSHVPEDRQKHGLVLSFSVRDNLVLCTYYRSPFASGPEINYPIVEQKAEELVEVFDIRTPGIMTRVGTLSGGNQQKVIVARELSRPVNLLIASQPTRGLDVGSIEFIHHRIVEARDAGAAVLLISAELDEIMSLSDRIAVMYKGRILATLDAKDATREKLGLLMAGVVKETAHV
jgi:general nucleoside transport system ATP-binding protein